MRLFDSYGKSDGSVRVVADILPKQRWHAEFSRNLSCRSIREDATLSFGVEALPGVQGAIG